jgi:hypothetical protein
MVKVKFTEPKRYGTLQQPDWECNATETTIRGKFLHFAFALDDVTVQIEIRRVATVMDGALHIEQPNKMERKRLDDVIDNLISVPANQKKHMLAEQLQFTEER